MTDQCDAGIPKKGLRSCNGGLVAREVRSYIGTGAGQAPNIHTHISLPLFNEDMLRDMLSDMLSGQTICEVIFRQLRVHCFAATKNVVKV